MYLSGQGNQENAEKGAQMKKRNQIHLDIGSYPFYNSCFCSPFGQPYRTGDLRTPFSSILDFKLGFCLYQWTEGSGLGFSGQRYPDDSGCVCGGGCQFFPGVVLGLFWRKVTKSGVMNWRFHPVKAETTSTTKRAQE
jgi:hypothetical protein